MPLTYDESLYQALYNVGKPDGSGRINYSRELYDLNRAWIGRRISMFPPGIIANSSIVVVGCGFGWLIEQLIDSGASDVVGVDPSPYVHENSATESRADVDIVNATVGIDDVASSLQSAGHSRTYQVVVDEDAASSHSDSELSAFLDGCEALLRGNQKSRIVHLVTPALTGGGDSAINWKTMAEWKALRPTHTWVDIRSGEVA